MPDDALVEQLAEDVMEAQLAGFQHLAAGAPPWSELPEPRKEAYRIIARNLVAKGWTKA